MQPAPPLTSGMEEGKNTRLMRWQGQGVGGQGRAAVLHPRQCAVHTPAQGSKEQASCTANNIMQPAPPLHSGMHGGKNTRLMSLQEQGMGGQGRAGQPCSNQAGVRRPPRAQGTIQQTRCTA